MKLVATMPVRNEDWVLGVSLRALLRWVDAVVVGLHCCTDESQAIVQAVSCEYPGRLTWMIFTDPTWSEMNHRQQLLASARRTFGATHIAIVDADEILTGNLLPTIRDRVAKLVEGQVLQLPWVCMARGVDRYYTSGTWGTNFVSMAFHDLPKYGWAAREGYDFHHRHPIGSTQRDVVRQLTVNDGGLMHLQFVSERRLRAKQALYLMTERLRWPWRQSNDALNAMYGKAVYDSDPEKQTTAQAPLSWLQPYVDEMKAGKSSMFSNPNPPGITWQEFECKRLIAEHGRDKFDGLDLFGIA